MHLEIIQDKPGRCPKCGMALVAMEEKTDRPTSETDDQGLRSPKWRSYIPMIVIVLLIAATATVVSWHSPNLVYDFALAFMTAFFLVFAGFKLMDLGGFAKGYSTYDLLAQRWVGYGYLYPFMELAFGLIMLAGYHPDGLLWAEFAVMAFGGVGVLIKLAKKEQFQCACLGTFLKVPLTYVTLVEDFGMAILALLLIFSNQ